MKPAQLAALGALRNQLHNLEETIGDLHHLTLSDVRPQSWDHVHELVTCLDSVADAIRQALDSMD